MEDYIKKALDIEGSYFDFTGGADIPEDRVKEWIEEAIRDVAADLNENQSLQGSFTTVSSGNTKVFVEGYRQNNGKITFITSISTSHCKLTETDVKI